jgi:hypothetical protein
MIVLRAVTNELILVDQGTRRSPRCTVRAASSARHCSYQESVIGAWVVGVVSYERKDLPANRLVAVNYDDNERSSYHLLHTL